MKYLLKIMLLSVAIIPFFVWELLVSLWYFRSQGVKELWYDYTSTVSHNYRKAFPRRSHKHKPSTF